MSAASRQREADRLLLHYRRGHPTMQAFREWQTRTLAAWFAGATFTCPFPHNPPTFAIAETQRLARIWLDGGEAMTYPEPTIPDPS